MRADRAGLAAWRRVAVLQGVATLAAALAIGGALFAAGWALVSWAKTHPDANIHVDTGGVLFWKLGSVALGVLGFCEWWVIAWSREHHEQISRRMSLAVGVAPEDPERRARIRLDARWFGRRMKRWWRGVLGLGAMMPAIAVTAGLAGLVVGRSHAFGALMFAWSIYWGAVVAAAKTSRAWRSEGDASARPPWFVRALSALPVVRIYGRIVGRLTRSSHPPAREIEPCFFEMLGLAVARTIVGLPILYAFVRPTLPVAAAMILERRSCSPLPRP